jgi:hypothetical protein
MVEQLFTTRGEAKGNEKKRKEQLCTARREKRSNGEADRDEREEAGLTEVGFSSTLQLVQVFRPYG